MILEKIKLLEELVIYLNASDKSVVSKAINFSNKAHKNQTRQSGDPFVTHPIEVAKILNQSSLMLLQLLLAFYMIQLKILKLLMSLFKIYLEIKFLN